LFDELAAASRPISLAKFNLYVFRRLRSEFKDLVISLSTKDVTISYTDLHSSLLTREFLHKASLQPSVTSPLLPTPTQQSAVFFVQHQSGFSTSKQGWFCGGWRPNNQQCGQHGNQFSSGSSSRITGSFRQQGNHFGGYNRNIKCQLCYEYRHTTQQCSQLATHLTQANGNLAFNNVSTTTPITWFPDTGANHQVTPDLVSMTSSEHYLGNDHLHIGDGKGLVISNISHSKIRSPKCTFTLSNILYVPAIKKPLLSVQKFYLENNVFFEFHSSLFYVKEE
jgi:histone deacetylase 1/2